MRYASTLALVGRTAIRVKLSLQVGQNGRNRFTLGIAITVLVYQIGLMVDGKGFEPSTPALRTRCSPN